MSKINHIGIIMDGNRRWAKENGLSSFDGHKKGYEKLKEVGQWCIDRDINILSVYAFSTENWNRSKQEVKYLMKLLNKVFTDEVEKFNKKGIRIRVIGSRDKLSKEIKKNLLNAQERTKNNKKGTLNLCFNYGGRPEIAQAVKEIIKKGLKESEITEETITKNTWMGDQPDPELIIRTSGEQRLSGFLTWQSVYSEFYFTKCHWPEFSEKDLDEAVKDYEKRQRRFGGN
jgi:undecaprenyl diphosphate synthase